jgi:hypothetical protein
MALDRKAIEAANKPHVEEVNVPEWGGSVYVRTLSGHEMARFSAVVSNAKPKDVEQQFVRFAAMVLADENGKRLYSDDEIEKVGELEWRGLQRVVEAGQELNGLSDVAVETEKGK